MLTVAIVVLAAGTFALRFAGPALRSRVDLPEEVEALLATAVVVLLAALVATASLTRDQGLADAARPAGVLVGGLLAWRRAPLVAVVLAAAGTAAGLRLLGAP